MKLSRLVTTGAVGLLSLSLAACGGGSTAGSGESAGGGSKTTFKLAFNQTEQHPQFKAAVEFGKKLEEATDGRYTIKAYANEQLGTQSDVIQNVSDGTVEFMYVGGPVVESMNSDFIVYNLPYVFDSVEAQKAIFRDQELNADLFSSLEESKNITVLAALHAGTRSVYNSKRPIKTPADMEGLKIRVQQSESQVKMLELMGGIGTPMGQGEVYAAMQSGVLDGGENNPTVFDALKHDEVAKYYSYTRHLMIPDYLLMSTKALEGMNEADREALLKLVPEVQDFADNGFADYIAESEAKAKEKGAEFNEVDDPAAFKELVQPLVTESINNDVRQKLFDAIGEANKANPAK